MIFTIPISNCLLRLFRGFFIRNQSPLCRRSRNLDKTWNLLAACIAVGMGKSWMGFERCKPVRVLYVNLELHTEELKKRIDMVAAAMGTTRAALQGHVDFLNLKGQRNQIDRVLARIRSYGNA